jgi:hypothetical protein
VAHCLRSLEINRQLERTWLFDRQISRFSAAQNPGHHSGALTVDFNKARTIPQQTTLVCGLGPLVDCGQTQFSSAFNDDAAIEMQHRRRQHVERGSTLCARIINGRNYLGGVCCTNDQQLFSVTRSR